MSLADTWVQFPKETLNFCSPGLLLFMHLHEWKNNYFFCLFVLVNKDVSMDTEKVPVFRMYSY